MSSPFSLKLIGSVGISALRAIAGSIGPVDCMRPGGAGRAGDPYRLVLAAMLGIGGCQSSQVVMNQPLPLDAAGRPDYARNYGVGSFAEDQMEEGSELLTFLAFSGGGKRSAAFAHGVLRGLQQVPVQGLGGAEGRSLLEDVDYIAAVSGGSFPAAHYGLYRGRSFETFPEEFLYRDIESHIYGMFLLPWNWEWLVNPLYGTNDYMAEVYDRLMFHGATYADLARRGPPLISVNATDIVNGVTFAFLGGTFSLLCSDITSFPIARAVAASNGFPVLFTPITLRSYAERCAGTRPRFAPPPQSMEPHSETSRRAQLARLAQRLSDPERTHWVHLMDGGIADNLALRGLLNILLALDDRDVLFRAVALRTRRILVVSADGQAAADPTLGQQRVVTGLKQIFSAVSGTQIDAYNFETLALARAQVESLAGRFRAIRCATAPVIRGRPCGDVRAALVHVSLSGIDDPETRARLQAIPTGLTIPREDVDLLVGYGERLVREHPVIRAMATDVVVPGPNAGGTTSEARRAAATLRRNAASRYGSAGPSATAR